MNTAGIVVLTIAVGAIGAAACAARRTPNRFTAPNIIRTSARDGRAFRRGDNIQVATQK